MNESFHFERFPEKPTPLPETEFTVEEKYPHLTKQIAEELRYDLSHYNYRKGPQFAKESRLRNVYSFIDQLPLDAQEAVISYVKERDRGEWKEKSSGLNSPENLRISDALRQEKHDNAARKLIEYDPERFPDLITAREFLKRMFDDFASEDVAEALRDTYR